jgi:hypothetical protein
MNKDSTDFILEEYGHIDTTFFSLQTQLTEWFKAYLTLVGLPLATLTAIFKISSNSASTQLPTLGELPDIVSGLLFVVCFLGLLVTLSIVNMRMEMILYARWNVSIGLRQLVSEFTELAMLSFRSDLGVR